MIRIGFGKDMLLLLNKELSLICNDEAQTLKMRSPGP